jgi:Protein of unknown function (DUF2569).
MFLFRSDLNGIGGWLIPVAIGLAIAPFLSLRGIYRDFRLLNASGYSALEAYRGLAVLVLFEAITNTIYFLSEIGLNILFYRHKKTFPGWMITFYCAQIFFTFADHVAAIHYSPGGSFIPLIRTTLGAAIWIPYYLVSQRVKATFVS